MKKIVAALVALMAIPVVVGGAASGAMAPRPIDSEALDDIPPDYAQLYLEAASHFDFGWQLLAAVGKVECDHGRGDCYHPNHAGAMGPMQFMPGTWPAYRTASGQPPYDVYDPRDAIFAAAAKLSADGIRTLPRAALFSYNRSEAYVDEVLDWAVRYGWISGDARALAQAVLSHPHIELRPDARADLEAGLVDQRVLAALLRLAVDHRLRAVGPFVSGHSVYVKGTTRVSNHAVGRAVDIPIVNGHPVSASNVAARAAAESLVRLPPQLRPDELGGPWHFSVSGVSSFTKNHHTHIHIGYSP
ncbi:MAG: transglycosylase SLT domain-containing protein [Chloroflexi bacterium]|nr:transglycosylase SLT domain-containing protein [Chloroflexota bacterium]